MLDNAASHIREKVGFSVIGLCAAAGLIAVVTGAPVSAGDKGAQAAPRTADAKNKSAWVKLCEKAPFNRKDKEGKAVKAEKRICLTHHERLDEHTGRVWVKAAIKEIEGSEKPTLMIMVPLTMSLSSGLRAAIYSKEQWHKAAKNEKVEEKALKPFSLKFTLCDRAGCTAETAATSEIIEQMKKGAGLMVLAVNAAGQQVGFPVPLTGFSKAYSGEPLDSKEYAKSRNQLITQMRMRQAEAWGKQITEQEKKVTEHRTVRLPRQR